MTHAVVLIRAEREALHKLGGQLAEIDGVSEAYSVTGEWDFTVETQAGPGNPHFSLKQDGTTLSGTYKGALGEAPITGTVSGNEVTIKFKASAQGADLDVTYQGTVEGDTMKGKLSLGDFGDGTFTAKKVG